MSTTGHALIAATLTPVNYGLTRNPQEIDRLIDRHRAINAVEAKLAHLLEELGEEMEAEHRSRHTDS